MEKIEILKMEKKHLDEVALLHLETFKDYPSTKLGKIYIKAFLKLFLESKFSICFVAVESKKICGYVVGIENDKLKTKKILHIILFCLLKRPYLFFNKKILKKIYSRLRNFFKVNDKLLPDLPNPFISLVGIGVDPKKRKAGIGNLLMESFEKEAMRKRYKAMRLSVYNENFTARKLYEKRGWKSFHLPFDYLYYYKILNYDEK